MHCSCEGIPMQPSVARTWGPPRFSRAFSPCCSDVEALISRAARLVNVHACIMIGHEDVV